MRSGVVWRRVRVSEALSAASDRLLAAGAQTPRLDAELLLAEVLEVGREQLVMRASEGLGADSAGRFDRLVDRRVAREPVAYIIGRKPFRGISLSVDRRVLIPRPETELLVEVGLELPSGARVADVGTGSGAVALALKVERPDLRVLGTDVSADAVEVARANAAALALDVEFVQVDLLDGVDGGFDDGVDGGFDDGVDGGFDAVLANLPYVAEGEELAPEITRYEPAEALFAGPDGLSVIRRLVSTLSGVPLLALEVGFDQADAVAGLVAAAGFDRVERVRDLAGHERVVVGRR